MTRDEQLKEIDIPKKPIRDKTVRYGHGYEYRDWICPTCGFFLAWEPSFDKISKRCNNCGQLLQKLTREEAETEEDNGVTMI